MANIFLLSKQSVSIKLEGTVENLVPRVFLAFLVAPLINIYFGRYTRRALNKQYNNAIQVRAYRHETPKYTICLEEYSCALDNNMLHD